MDMSTILAVMQADRRDFATLSAEQKYARVHASVNMQSTAAGRAWMRDAWRAQGVDVGETYDEAAERLRPLADAALNGDSLAEAELTGLHDQLPPIFHLLVRRVLPHLDRAMGLPIPRAY